MPSQEPTELRDAGLLQLFFADLGSADDRQALAVAQLAIHRAALARYEDDRRAEGMLNGSDGAARTVEHWRGVTLPMGLLYERAAVEFWEGVAAPARVDGATADRSRAEDDGARLALERELARRTGRGVGRPESSVHAASLRSHGLIPSRMSRVRIPSPAPRSWS